MTFRRKVKGKSEKGEGKKGKKNIEYRMRMSNVEVQMRGRGEAEAAGKLLTMRRNCGIVGLESYRSCVYGIIREMSAMTTGG
ncbi:MAG: hypothetical protein ACYTEO_06960 [Planctomycetota bacterium]|jgi:hypothetical protein